MALLTADRYTNSNPNPDDAGYTPVCSTAILAKVVEARQPKIG